MKFETIQCSAPGELRGMLKELVAKHGRPTKTDKILGGVSSAAVEIGVPIPMIAQTLSGAIKPGFKILNYFGLEMRRVLVRKGQA